MRDHPYWLRELLTSKLWQRQAVLAFVGMLFGWGLVDFIRWVLS